MKLIAMLMMAADPNGQPLPEVVLLDFTASYCQPCQQMVPMLQRMERDKFPIRKFDISKRPDVTKQYQVDRIPTLILMVEGKEVRRFVGLTAEEELRQAMNDAARKLDMERRNSGGNRKGSDRGFEDFARNQPNVPEPAVAQKEEPQSGFGAFMNRMKRGLTGESKPEQPNVRAQSPDMPNTNSITTLPMQATVRISLKDGNRADVGTGTIVHSTMGQSTILTCAHIFRDASEQSQVSVEVFNGNEPLVYPAKVVGGDHESDVAFIQIQNTSPLPTVPLKAGPLKLLPGQPLFSVGCSKGALPTILNMKVEQFNKFLGPENIVCDVDPLHGRSGGGLFDSTGALVGVCGGAFRDHKEGLYTGVGAVRQLVTQLKLNALFENDPEAPVFAAAPPETDPRDAANPFVRDDDQFDQLFADEAAPFDDTEPAAPSPFESVRNAEAPMTAKAPTAMMSHDSGSQGRRAATPPPASSGTPVATGMARSAILTRTTQPPAEITVIIDSKDPAKGKQVIVIPRPSPWLLELLTGETQSADPQFSTARGTDVSHQSFRPVSNIQRQ